MRKPLPPDSPARPLVDEEVGLLGRVHTLLAREDERAPGGPPPGDFERDLIALRDQIAEEKPEDLASLVEQMTRVQAIATGRKSRAQAPIDPANPYFAHLRLRVSGREAEQEILIGRRGLIDRAAGVQIVDWRDAPISQIY